MRIGRICRLLLAGSVICALVTAETQSKATADEAIAQKAAICAACHGTNGIPISKDIPVIWGEHAGYLFFELRDFQSGARKSQVMAPVTKDLSRADMLALAEDFEARPWPDLNQPRAPANVTAKAQALEGSGQCPACHLAGYLGAGTTPRLAGQSIDYLRRTMEDFHTGMRGNNPWMAALLKTFSDSDIGALALYLGGL
jgi:cytochrome c553